MTFKHLAFAFSLSVVAAGCAANLNEKVIAVVGDKQITYGEFQQQYAQNALPSGDTTDAIAKKENFLKLLIDYDLKLLDANKQHLRDNPAISSEMKNYETQLAEAYILEHELTDPAVRTIYDRRKYEVRAEQVFIRIKPDSLYPQGDTLKAYDEAKSVIKALDNGAPIDSLIHAYQGGDTYYITAGSFLQYPGGRDFEDLLYSLKPGQVGQDPIRTSFGYLVIKLTDKRPRYERIRASHILIRTNGNTPADTLAAYDKAIAILDSAKAGVDFAKLAEDNSADTVSGKRGGDLGYFSRGMMVRPFDEAAFDLKVGQIAGPVRTQFGYHIIKLTDIQPVPPFSQVKDELRTNYLNQGYKLDLERFVDQLKNRYDYREDAQTIRDVIGKVDSMKSFEVTDFDSLLSAEILGRCVFTFTGDSATVDTVIAIAKSNEKYSSLPVNTANFNLVTDDAAKEYLLAHYATQKAPTYPEFDSLIAKYEDGILIYQIEQNEVWSKIATDDSVLRPYFEKNAQKYEWPRRADLSKIEVKSSTVADSLYHLLEHGADFDTLAARYNSDKEQKSADGHWGLFADSSNSLATEAFTLKKGGVTKPEVYEGWYCIVKVNDFIPPQPKTYEEAKAEVSSDYQEYESKLLQKDWMDRLRQEFGVKIDEKMFHELLAKE